MGGRSITDQFASSLIRFKKPDKNFIDSINKMAIDYIIESGKFDFRSCGKDNWGFRFVANKSKSYEFWCGIYISYPQDFLFGIRTDAGISYDLPRVTRGTGKWYEIKPLLLNTAFRNLTPAQQCQRIKDYLDRGLDFAVQHEIN